MNDIEKVREFVRTEGPRYNYILKLAYAACQEVKAEMGGDIVTRIYSRSTKQDSELKDTEKIFAACPRPVTPTNLKALEDIIGLTMVVQYPDQVDAVLDAVLAKLKHLKIEQLRRKVHEETYFATHMVLISHATGYGGLKCEVQCKTMLHDAWSTKMHDLTYKPQGSLDDGMKSLIETISGTIEGLERQSQIVRDMILARQLIERRPFQASLDALYSGLSKTLAEDWKEGQANENLKALRERLEKERAHLRSCSINDEALDQLAQDIGLAATDPQQLRGAWLLAVRLAGFRPEPKFAAYLNDQVQLVMDVLADWRAKGGFTGREIGAIPIGFYVIQDFTRALEYTDLILDQADKLNLKPFRRMVLRLNKLTWLLERESLRPSKPDKREELEHSIAKNLREMETDDCIISDPQYADLLATYRDALGLLTIVFGKTTAEVREGIAECTRALTEDGEPSEKEVDNPYAEWRTQVGWRRYFDLAEKER